MIEKTIEVNRQLWRVKAKNEEAALNEIAHARCTGSVGSSSYVDNRLVGGSISLIAEVHKINKDGSDVKPS